MPSNLISAESGDRRVLANVPVRRRATFLLLFAVLLPVIVGFGILYKQALSVPYQDDYHAILGFAIDYEQLPTYRAKLVDIATAQHNEYKLGFENAIVAAEVGLTHHLNFAFLTAMGNLFLLPIGYLLWQTYRGQGTDLNERLLEFLPISLCFFSLTYWENLNWAMTELQNIPVVLLGFLAIYLLTAKKALVPTWTHLLLGCLSAALAAATSANAFLLGPVGLLILLSRRAYAKSLVWCASFVLPLAAYLYHYTPVVHVVDKAANIMRPLFFLGFLGCVIPSRRGSILLGIVVLSIVFIAIRARFDRTNPVAFYVTLWSMGTGLLVAWVRGGSGFPISSRYSMYSNLLVIFCYSFLAQYLSSRSPSFNRRRFYVASTVIAAGGCLMVDVSAYRHLEARRRMVLTGIEFYRANPEANSPMIDPLVEKALIGEKELEHVTLTRALQTGVYALPPKQEIR